MRVRILMNRSGNLDRARWNTLAGMSTPDLHHPYQAWGYIALAILALSGCWPAILGATELPPKPADLTSESEKLAALLPQVSREGGYVSSDVCATCHEEEHASWHRSYHRTMTQVALPANVAGTFDGTVIRSEGLDYRVSREGDEFWAEMPDPDVMMYIVQGGKKLNFDQVPRRRLRVVLSTGSHHYQTYWVVSPRYELLMQTLPLVYLLEDRRWVPREAAFMHGPKDAGRFITQWNHHCIRCHSTGGNPGLNRQTGMLETRLGEFGVACEACHGPGEAHVNYRRQQEGIGPDFTSAGSDPIVNPKKLDHRRSSQVCGQCHGVFVMRDEFAMQSAYEPPLYKPGEDLHKTRYYIQFPSMDGPPERQADLQRNPDFFRERWWDDGMILAGGREFTALSVTGCYLRGEISCLSCHSMHRSDPNDQLKHFASDNAQCTQCHDEARYTEDLPTHTFHRADSSGSNCLNCHMPYTTYALFKGIRSHQISSPQLASDAPGNAPNACNLCHLDQTLAWTQNHLNQWYAAKPVPLSEEQKNVAASLLWLLKGNAARRVIAAWHFGWKPAQEISGADWPAPFVATLLKDSYGVVRFVAARSLRTLPRFQDFEYDFLGAESALKARSLAATQAWRTHRGTGPANRSSRILIDEDGEVMDPVMKLLLGQRDNRSVTIKE